MALEKTLKTTLAALAQNQLTQLFFADVKKKNRGEWIKRFTLKGHKGQVVAVAVLPSGQVVSGSFDHTLKVWNVQNGQCLQTLKGYAEGEWSQGHFEAVAVLPSGQVVSRSRNNTLKVWDVQNGQCLQTLEGHTRQVHAIAALPSGQIVSGSDDKTLKVWDVKKSNAFKS